MTNSTKITIILFKICLFSVLGFMVIEQLNHYFKNDDVSSLHYKKFYHHKQDTYPTFSVCIASYRGGLFKDALGVHKAELYSHHLQGKLNEDPYNISSLDYDDVVVDVRKLFELYHRKSKGIDGKLLTTMTQDFDEVFQLSYQNHEKICFTKKEVEGDQHLIEVDLMKISADWLDTHDSQCLVYIHLKGQFLRSLGKPAATLIGKDLFEEKSDVSLMGRGLCGKKPEANSVFLHTIKSRINSVDVLRKRYDADEKCNRTLQNDDIQYLEHLIQTIQCIPPFMGDYVNGLVSQTNLPECDKKKLYKLAFNFSVEDSFDAVAKHYLQPCTQMSSVVTTTESQKKSPNTNKPSVALSFEYPVEYRETLNQREYSIYDLWSQIGGVVGIIVGYSLMQIPQTIERTFVWSQEFHKKRYEMAKLSKNKYEQYL